MTELVTRLIKHDMQQPIDLQSRDIASFVKHYQQMLLIRRVEDKVAELVKSKLIRCPTHLGAGQEAIAVGVCDNLSKNDYVFGTHRAHAHYFAMGGDLRSFFAEVLGKKTGCSRGLGGSMHLIDTKNGFWGSVPIVGATIPIAAGAALAIKRQNKDAVAVCFFGDGATEEGVMHESLNLAASIELPVLFVCENNLYSSHLDINSRQPSQRTARFAEAHCIKSDTIDGNNVLAVKQSSDKMIEYIKSSGKPAFIEFITYRLYGHVGPNKDVDVGVRRSLEDMEFWRGLDPIKRLESSLLEAGFTKDKFSEISDQVDNSILESLNLAYSDPYPDPSELLDNVYSSHNKGKI